MSRPRVEASVHGGSVSKILELRGCVRDYSWGSRSYLCDLFGFENKGREPQAEYWMGAHPGGPSEVCDDSVWRPLRDWIAEDPEGRLGVTTTARFAGELPFLFKILAAELPLSLQAHPNAEQAEAGFEDENTRGVPIDDPARNYRDARPKSELLCALTPFDAMLGFRESHEICELLAELDIPELAARTGSLRDGDASSLRDFFASLLCEDENVQSYIAHAAAARCRSLPAHPARAWVLELAKQYPDDVGVLAPLLLNVIRLEPGQAVFLPAGELHSYLKGCGIEIMASSDNVLRGGLTNKHMDVTALLDVLTFSQGQAVVLDPSEASNGARTYKTPAADFELSRVDVLTETTVEASGSLEILLFSQGAGQIAEVGDPTNVDVSRGMSVVVPAAVGDYRVTGSCSFFRATVPDPV